MSTAFVAIEPDGSVSVEDNPLLASVVYFVTAETPSPVVCRGGDDIIWIDEECDMPENLPDLLQ